MLSPSLIRALRKGWITAIVYDLDGVMYCHSTGLEQSLIERIYSAFSSLSGVTIEEAKRLTWASYNVHGTSYSHYLEYGITPESLAEAVYCDAPLTGLAPCTTLQQQLTLLERVFPCLGIGSNSVLVHPRRVLNALGVGDRFKDEQIVTLCKTGFQAKPKQVFFDTVVASTGVAPASTLFIEDNSRNIEALHNLGFWTGHITSINHAAQSASSFADASAASLQEMHYQLLSVFR